MLHQVLLFLLLFISCSGSFLFLNWVFYSAFFLPSSSLFASFRFEITALPACGSCVASASTLVAPPAQAGFCILLYTLANKSAISHSYIVHSHSSLLHLTGLDDLVGTIISRVRMPHPCSCGRRLSRFLRPFNSAHRCLDARM